MSLKSHQQFFTNESYSDYVLESYKMYDECKLTKTCDQKCEIVYWIANCLCRINKNKQKNVMVLDRS